MEEEINKENYKGYKSEDFLSDDRLKKILKDAATSQELLDKFLKESPENSRDIKIAAKIIQELNADIYQNTEIHKLAIWDRIVSKQAKLLRLKFFRYAAAILLIASIGSLSLYIIYNKPVVEKYYFTKEITSNDVILVLADNKQISIKNDQAKIQYTHDGARIIIDDTSKLNQTIAAEGTNQIIVPFGKRLRITLSDGSVVWLNSGSKLIYAPVFKGKNRNVLLEGEAFFDIAKNPDRPFYVHTKAFDIQVVGTRFNVQAYNDDNEDNVIVVEGKVSLKTNGQSSNDKVILDPNQKGSLLKGQKNFQINNVEDGTKYVDWIDGYYYFEREYLSNVLKKISRYYNINIELKLYTDISKIYGKLDLKNDPEQVLRGLAIISNANYTKEADIYIFDNK